jgi:hypothetical protein
MGRFNCDRNKGVITLTRDYIKLLSLFFKFTKFSPKLVNVDDRGELSLVIVNCDQLVLVKEDQVEADGLEHAGAIFLPYGPLHVVRDGNGARVLARFDVKE